MAQCYQCYCVIRKHYSYPVLDDRKASSSAIDAFLAVLDFVCLENKQSAALTQTFFLFLCALNQQLLVTCAKTRSQTLS